MLVVRGEPVELDAHLARITASAREIYAKPVPPNAHALVREHANALELGRVRLTLSPTSDAELRPTFVAAAVDERDVFPSWERAARLGRVVVADGLGAHKWADRGELERIEKGLGEGRLALLVSEAGEVLEVSRANLFAIERGVLLTPPADGAILAGVSRARALQAARSLGADVREERLSLERVLAASEVFLTGSVRGLEPVRTLEGSVFSPPGELVRELGTRMKQRWFSSQPQAPPREHVA